MMWDIINIMNILWLSNLQGLNQIIVFVKTIPFSLRPTLGYESNSQAVQNQLNFSHGSRRVGLRLSLFPLIGVNSSAQEAEPCIHISFSCRFKSNRPVLGWPVLTNMAYFTQELQLIQIGIVRNRPKQFGVFQLAMGVPQFLDGLYWKISFKWMIWGYPHVIVR